MTRKLALCWIVGVLAGSLKANDICLPSVLWMLSDTQNDIFVEPMIRRWRPNDDYVRFSVEGQKMGFLRRLNRVASIERPVNGAILKVDLVEGEEFETVKSVKCALRVGQKGVGGNDVCAQIIGDSYTQGGFFKKALLDSGNVPKLRLVGLRKCADGQHDEGRGGWTLAQYFVAPKGNGGVIAYHGFMHPEDGHYWGDCAFWRTAWMCVRGAQPQGFEPQYSCGRFDDFVSRFDEQTGVLRDPKQGDYQFALEPRKLVRYDGKAWRPVEEKSVHWQFDYGKYLKMWNIPPPQFLFVMLGLNDFRDDLKADFSQWRERIGIVKDSYLNACPNGRFVICIPCSTCGSIDNVAGDFTPRQNAAMWRFRNWLIQTFDNREQEGFYLLDTGVGIDGEYGYWTQGGKVAVPFAGCESDMLRVQRGTPHPYANYANLGIPLAAFIQYYRNSTVKKK